MKCVFFIFMCFQISTLFVLFVVMTGRQSPVLSKIYLFGHVFLSQEYKQICQAYSTKLALVGGRTRSETGFKTNTMRKVSQLVQMNEESGNTIFDFFLNKYIVVHECFLWETIRPQDAHDNYKQHDPDFNDWKLGSQELPLLND